LITEIPRENLREFRPAQLVQALLEESLARWVRSEALRMHPARVHFWMTGALVCLFALGLCGAAAATGPGDEAPAASAAAKPASPAPDFLFRRPSGSVGIGGSWVFARAGSDLFAFVEDQLTVDKGDFSAPAFAADVSLAIAPRLDAVFGFEFTRTSTRSEYRDFVDNDFLPIEQTTELKTINLGGSIQYALVARGREVSRLAWVPRRMTPYVGAGAGALWYEFRQFGDFVDFVDLSVFPDVFRSRGWTPTAHAFGGVDVHVYRRLFMIVEGRYVWASAKLGPDFVDFEPIDLAGFRMAGGVNVVF
jgi:hypothetical protein